MFSFRSFVSARPGNNALLLPGLENNSERLRARTTTGSISGIALAEDLDYPRAHWLGRTLWSKEMSLLTRHEQTDAMGTLRIKKCAPLKFMEIAPGWDEQKPVRFVLETSSGEKGFLDVNLSGVNARQESQNLSRLEQVFFTKDLWAKRKWSPGVRAAIESGKIMPGMTIRQVWMSWGSLKRSRGLRPATMRSRAIRAALCSSETGFFLPFSNELVALAAHQ